MKRARAKKPKQPKTAKARVHKPRKSAVHKVRAQRIKVAKKGTAGRSSGVKRVVTRTD